MFGKDVEFSSSKRLAFERAEATRAFFPGEKCLGAFLTFKGQDSANVVVDLGFVDGMDAWHRGDFDDASSFVANVEIPFAEGSVAGISYMTSSIDVAGAAAAQSGTTTMEFEPDVFGAHVRYHGTGQMSGLALQAEYFDGDWYNHKAYSMLDADGWYATLEYTPQDAAVTPFYRYDEFNVSHNIATAQVGGEDEYVRHTIGVAYEPFANNRLTLQVEDIDDMGDEDTTVGLQWQVVYK